MWGAVAYPPHTGGGQYRSELVGDVINIANINPTGSSTPSEFGENLENLAWFTAFTTANGRELYRSDGTGAGTALAYDICPGSCSSFPTQLTVSGHTVYFVANDGVHGNELWWANGGGGSGLLVDIQAGPASTDIRELTDDPRLGGFFYPFFSAFQSGDSARRLWYGRTKIGAPANPRDLLIAGDKLYFTGEDAQGAGVWESNGTAGGTQRVADIMAGAGSSKPRELVAVGSAVYFIADDGKTGEELWKYEPGAGAVQVKDIVVGSGSPFADTNLNPSLTVLGDFVYFVADVPGYGKELWRTDGTSSGTVVVADLVAGSNSSYPQELTAAAGFLFFSADDGVKGRELWRSNGSLVGTVRMTDIEPGPGSSSPAQLTATSDEVFFLAESTTYGTEVWRADLCGASRVAVLEVSEILGYYQWKGHILFFGELFSHRRRRAVVGGRSKAAADSGV